MHEILEEHYKKNKKHITHMLTRSMGDDAEDVVQEAYLRAWKYIHSFNPNEFKFQNWFSRILSNVRKDFISEKFGRSTHEEFDDGDEDVGDFSFNSNASKLMEIVYDEILLAENEDHREILTLFLIYGYKLREVVEIVDMKMGTVNQILTRFRLRLKETYA